MDNLKEISCEPENRNYKNILIYKYIILVYTDVAIKKNTTRSPNKYGKCSHTLH